MAAEFDIASIVQEAVEEASAPDNMRIIDAETHQLVQETLNKSHGDYSVHFARRKVANHFWRKGKPIFIEVGPRRLVLQSTYETGHLPEEPKSRLGKQVRELMDRTGASYSGSLSAVLAKMKKERQGRRR